MLKQKLHYFGHLMWRADSLEKKNPDARKDWGNKEKGVTENKMVGWHQRLNGHMFGWTLGVGDGQGGLACCSPWGCKESHMTEWLNWTEGFQQWASRNLSVTVQIFLSQHWFLWRILLRDLTSSNLWFSLSISPILGQQVWFVVNIYWFSNYILTRHVHGG